MCQRELRDASGAVGTYRLIARSESGATPRNTGSEIATPPGATEIEVSPAKVRMRSVPARTDAPVELCRGFTVDADELPLLLRGTR